ncbi:TetR/AcrR family transcriptional regulator [Streptomyces otsuchiensis]|uniref:TetR/AcrR family transcriptional regulator n=1 Tax=Streptomyces otsuchiensis TaxID=2681388 RepID=UPI00102F97AC|nr:TetR/AcrR family transcriptional regulator [Streptomyces otsuchiensis]
MGVRAEQRQETRRALLAEGRRRFAADGYAAVVLTEVARGAGVTKGAAYHHFDSKAGLFRAVLEEVQQEVADEVVTAADTESEPWRQLIAGCRAFLAASSAPGRRRVMLVDGPAALGWQEWRALDEAASGRHLAEALTALVDAGVIADRPVEPLTRLLSGAMNEAAIWLADSSGGDAGREANLTAATTALTDLLSGLRPSP